MFAKHVDMVYLTLEECERFDDFQNLFQAYFSLILHVDLQAMSQERRGPSLAGQRLLERTFGCKGQTRRCSRTKVKELHAPLFGLDLCEGLPVSVL